MPEAPHAKPWPHPLHASKQQEPSHAPTATASGIAYAELQVTSNFTFLTGASQPDELVAQAALLGHRAIAITDRNTLAGIVRAHVAAKEAGIALVVGCRIELTDPFPLSVLVYPTDRPAYGRLCQLLTLGKRRAEKGSCRLCLHDLIDHSDGLLAVAVPPKILDDEFVAVLQGLQRAFREDRLSIASARACRQDAQRRLHQIADLSQHVGVPLVATNDVHHHVRARRPLQDVLTCIRHGCTIEQAGFRLHANAERHLKAPSEMARLFAERPDAIARTAQIAERAAGFSLDQLRYEYPDEVVPESGTPMSRLIELTWAGAAHRYPHGVPDKVRAQVEHELRLIDDLRYAPYFLTVHDLVSFAVSRGILCQGRGAAANSAVCYCLGVTAVDPDRVSVLFERFISKERDEPPDIDIDFEHERREEVIQYIYGKYGRDRAALTAEVISYRGRSAIRDVGKAMGLSLDLVDQLAKELDWWSDTPDVNTDRLRQLGLNPNDPHLARVMSLARELMGFPRHLSQHVGGFVITRSPLCELVPIENAAMEDRTVIEWDKDDIDALGMLKVDCLGLGMLTCIRKCLELVEQHTGEALSLATIPPEDPATYDMICKADTIGVFQIESRAQMSMLPRLQPRCYYDLVIEVAIVRPGPIQGDMVHPYLRRRNGEEPIRYASPEIEQVLGRTLGVPLFQEQAMSLAVVAAGFSAGEADQLRRAIASWKRSGKAIQRFERKLIDGMIRRGFTAEFAQQVFTQISGFSGYGFPESHAASFALLVYASCWLKRHHPAAFAAALLNSQPMGFYQPAQIVRDAREHGVEVRPVDVNHSSWDCTLEKGGDGHGPAIRLGMRMVDGLPRAEADRLSAAALKHGAARTIAVLSRRSGARPSSLRLLAEADAFGSMSMSRQQALWEVQALKEGYAPLFEDVEERIAARACEPAPPPPLPRVHPSTEVSLDYNAVGLSLKAHPLVFLRGQLSALRVTPNAELADESRTPRGRALTVAGIVLVRQRPGTASGIVFMTIEDETGIANLIVRPQVYERFRRAARHSRMILCRGTLERAGGVVHVLARSIRTIDDLGPDLPAMSRDFH
ncbi:MAG: error-prone DNA polymerase [Phycisphaerales bacterium]|nr:error-prone DNA polymerase [Phycisphaerales bacterium]